ncbi:MAG: cyclic nucleotide-binding domain-containing protein [Spirochaetota bacterium]
MGKILFVSSTKKVADEIAGIVRDHSVPANFSFCDDISYAIEILSYELPELLILDFDDASLPLEPLLEKMREDPWLHYGWIIALRSKGSESEFLSAMRYANIIAVLRAKDMQRRLPSIVKIVMDNKHLLFQRDLQRSIRTTVSGMFIVDNDPYEVNVYASIISNYLFYSNYVDIEKRDNVKVALVELLLNAVEHGNCEITFEEKTRFSLEGGSIFDLIDEKLKDRRIAARRVNFSYRIAPERTHLIVRDEGKGFNWRMVKKPAEVNREMLDHGRGIAVAESSAGGLKYNEKGNEVSFDVDHQESRNNLVPIIFDKKDEISFNPGQTVFTMGEESNFLYYIHSGAYGVYGNRNKLIATLNSSDIFIGEMSFLLNDRRTATVRAHSQGTLIKISKKEFTDAIKRYPYYGLILARLLANRIDRMNKML